MESILQKATLSDVATLLLVLTSLWVLKIILQRRREYLVRAFLLFFLFLVGVIYVQQSEKGKLTLIGIYHKIVPPQTPEYNYRLEEGSLDFRTYQRYIFYDPKPKLSLTLSERGDYFYISNLSPLNSLLEYLGLPPVSEGVPELSSLTHSRGDVNYFRWEDYPLGVLLVEKSLCRNEKTLQTFHCVSSLTIKSRY